MITTKKRIAILVLALSLILSLLCACSSSVPSSAPAAAPEATPAVTLSATPMGAPAPIAFPGGLKYDVEAWAIGCSAVLATVNSVFDDAYDRHIFGMLEKNAENAEKAKQLLSDSWGCENRDDLVETILSLLEDGHTVDFAETYAYYNSFSDDEMAEFTAGLTPEDNSYLEFILYTGEAWGDKEIKAWDWFRAMHITGWGYVSGYLDIEETCMYMEQIIELLRGTFSSWDEATRNYLDGTAFWMEEDPYNQLSTYMVRMQIYIGLTTLSPESFDAAVWED